jgi:hypothetical protein
MRPVTIGCVQEKALRQGETQKAKRRAHDASGAMKRSAAWEALVGSSTSNEPNLANALKRSCGLSSAGDLGWLHGASIVVSAFPLARSLSASAEGVPPLRAVDARSTLSTAWRRSIAYDQLGFTTWTTPAATGSASNEGFHIGEVRAA